MDALSQSKFEALWAGYSGEALDYSEALAAARKNPVFGVDLKNVLSEGRRQAMTVALEDSEALAEEVRGAVEEAVREGTGLAEFRGRLDAITLSRGLSDVAPWHAETIFRTNSLAAYAGGAWTNLKALEAAGRIVAAEYLAVRDDRTRPNHLAMDGWWGPLDHPAWAIWWPPNGWNCRCFIRGLAPEEIEARGGLAAAPPAPAVSPDPGFEGNPGLGVWAIVGRHMA